MGIIQLDFLQAWPPEIATMLLAVLPVTEIRVSIPVALKVYNLSIFSAIFWSLVGNLATAAALILFIGPTSRFLSARFDLFRKMFDWLFARTRRKFYNKHSKYGDMALILFVAIPLPTTGCWSGALAAWLFGIPPKKSFILISAGILISAVIVTLITLGVVHYI